MYNLTPLQNSTTIIDLVVYANTITNGFFMLMLVLGTSFIFLVALMRYGFLEALWVTCFIEAILTLFLFYGGLVTMFYPLLFAGLTIFGIFLFYFKRD